MKTLMDHHLGCVSAFSSSHFKMQNEYNQNQIIIPKPGDDTVQEIILSRGYGEKRRSKRKGKVTK